MHECLRHIFASGAQAQSNKLCIEPSADFRDTAENRRLKFSGISWINAAKCARHLAHGLRLDCWPA